MVRLLASLAMVARHIPGSDGYKISRRNEIRGLMIHKGTPTLFISMSPSDVDHPLVRLYADGDANTNSPRGEELSEWKRKLLAAKNPAACAIFFDKMITAFIRTILCYGRDEPGVYGHCDAYYGTVEAQGKGTLHCHMLVWLRGHLPPQKTKVAMLSDVTYKEKMFRWLESIISNEFPTANMSTIEESHKAHPCRIVIKDGHGTQPGTTTGPLLNDFDNIDKFWDAFRTDVSSLLHQYNWHIHQATCWKYLSRGQKKTNNTCRMGMNGETREITSLDVETAAILLRRHHPWIASYTSIVTFLMRCNMDIKAVGSGEAAQAFLYYVTDYITKPSLPIHAGVSALTYAIDKTKGRLNSSGKAQEERHHTLNSAIVAVNSMMGRQEISHPQVMSYIVGGGDHYTSERFVALNWGAIIRHCNDFYIKDCSLQDDAENKGIEVNLSFGYREISASNQALDYRLRPMSEIFDSMCLYDFVACTVKEKININDVGKERPDIFSESSHPQYNTHRLRVRSESHIPVILGPTIPNPVRSMEAEEQWAKAVLLLFLPWRKPSDLKDDEESWISAYHRQDSLIVAKNQKIICNLNILNECKEARDVHAAELAAARAKAKVSTTSVWENENLSDKLADVSWADAVEADAGGFLDELQDVETAINVNDERMYAMIPDDKEPCPRLDELMGGGFLTAFSLCHPGSLDVIEAINEESTQCFRHDGDEDNERFVKLASYIESNKRKRSIDDGTDQPADKRRRIEEGSPIAECAVLKYLPWWNGSAVDREIVGGVILDMGLAVNSEQLRAFGIIAQHLCGKQNDQLLMYVGGVGGTGKSHLIKAVVLLFERLGRREELMLGAPTGIAAVLIGGSTLHSIVMVTPNGESSNLVGLGEIWKGVRYLIIDEISMVGAAFFHVLSSRICQAKAAVGFSGERPFGGVNLICTGDFGQLKPPGQQALYANNLIHDQSFCESRDKKSIAAMHGVFLWRQVNTVVKLIKNQRHKEDTEYSSFLERLRVGNCRKHYIHGKDDAAYLKSRLLNVVIDSGEDLSKFWDSPIIVGLKSLRDPLNAFMVNYHAHRLGQVVHSYYAKDMVHGNIVPGILRDELCAMSSSDNGDLFGVLPLFYGMKVMITENVSLPLGIVNGTEGVISNIEYEEDGGRRHAVLIYVHIKGSGIEIPGLPYETVPIFPVAKRLEYQRLVELGLKVKTFMRIQLPIVPAYAYTDFKSQGRSLERVRVDLNSAKGQGVYVMLSRVKTLSGLLILRDFSPYKIFHPLSEELRIELKRIDDLDAATSAAFG